MKTKVQAQRKFAQGAYVPPNANVINTLINRRVDAASGKQNRYFFRHNTSARRLLDSISFESIHTHKPVVVLERLQEQPIVQVDDEPNGDNELFVPVVNNVTSKTQLHTVSRRIPSLRNTTNRNASCLCTRIEKKIKKLAAKKKPSKNYLLKRLRHKQVRNRKCNMKLRSARLTSTVDTEFSIDDDKPLMFYTKKTIKTKQISKKQDRQQKTAIKTNKDIPTSLLAVTLHDNESSYRNGAPKRKEASYRNESTNRNEALKRNEPSIHSKASYFNDASKCNDAHKQNEALNRSVAPNHNEASSRNGTPNLIEAINRNEAPFRYESSNCSKPSNSNEPTYCDNTISRNETSCYNDISQIASFADLCPIAREIVQQVLNPQIHNNINQQVSIASNHTYSKTNLSEANASQPNDSFYGNNEIANWISNIPPLSVSASSLNNENDERQSFKVPRLPARDNRNKNSHQITPESFDNRHGEQSEVRSQRFSSASSLHISKTSFTDLNDANVSQPNDSFYGNNEIANWISNIPPLSESAASLNNENNEKQSFKVPRLPTRDNRNKNSLQITPENLNSRHDEQSEVKSKRFSSASSLHVSKTTFTDLNTAKTPPVNDLFYGNNNIANWMCNVHPLSEAAASLNNENNERQSFKVPRLPTRDNRNKNSIQRTTENCDSGHDAQSVAGSERSSCASVAHIAKTCSFCKSLLKIIKTYHKNKHRNEGNLTLSSGVVITSTNNFITSLQHALETGQLESHILDNLNAININNSEDLNKESGVDGSPSNLVECTVRNDPPSSATVEPQNERKTTRVTRRTGKLTQSEKEHETCSSENTDRGKIVEAPAFHPTEEDFRDPVAYFQKIMPKAAKFGLCKVIAPPGFNPSCTLTDSIRFIVTNQYIARLYSRWGPVTRELCALRSFLASQNITFSHSPLLEGLEVNLPKMLHFVQRQGGLKANVESRTYVDTRKWNRLAEELNYTKLNNPAKKLDQIYVKYLLPYDALTQRERQELTEKMDKRWSKRNDKLIQRAQNPLHRQKRLLGESDSSEDDDFEDDQHMTAALNEAEECVVRGRVMNLTNFKKIANNALKIFFPSTSTTSDIEAQYWKLVLLGNEHVCVNTASIDTGSEGYGFSKNKNDPYGRHPWNLKMLSQNNGNVLRSLGPVLGVTVPTLHVGMIYSTSCWHRDPHGLPWIEYMHNGPEKIWYGIPDSESAKFRRAVESLCPTACQNKSIWLPSDIAMIPPTLLLERNVSMSRVVQNPGEYIIVFPKAYSCSICTGYTVSESVYFATNSWVKSVNYVFQELRQSCEPTMFSLEQLLISVARDPNASLTMLQLVHESFSAILSEELENRRQIERHGLKPRILHSERRNAAGAWNVHENECEICRSTLYLSRVKGVFRKKYSVCLRHALQVLDGKNKKIEKRDTETFELDYFFGNAELEEVISSVIKRLTKTT